MRIYGRDIVHSSMRNEAAMTTSTENWLPSTWPDFDFRKLPLCSDSKNQLAGIYENVLSTGKIPEHRSKLLNNFIIANAFAGGR
jgi:hypothetical protein